MNILDSFTNFTITQQNIVENYINIVIDYTNSLDKSSFILPVHFDIILYIGINIIHRVYEYVLLKTESIKTADYYSQKSYVYLIEYMKQIHKNELEQKFNHNETILFIYRKTIFELQNKSGNNTDSICNIMTLNTDSIYNIDNCNELMNVLYTFINTLLYWNNNKITTKNRIHICRNYLLTCIKQIDNIDITNKILEYIRNKTTMDFYIYCKLLEELCKIKHKNDINKNEIILTKFYVEDNMFYEKIQKDNMKELVHWLYQPI
jgi:hypothetical protein